MLLLPINRENLLHFLPKGGCVAEIGVLAGDFSQHILEKTNPSCLHLIDPWKHQDRPDYAKDIANTPDDKQAGLFSSVLQKFSKEIRGGG